MNTFKKLLVGLVAIAVGLSVFGLFASSQQVAAVNPIPGGGSGGGSTTNPTSATSSQDIKNCIQNFKFVTIAEIDCKFTPAGGNSPITVQFIDTNLSDTNDGGCHFTVFQGACPRLMNYGQQGNFFVNGQPSSGSIGQSGATVNLPGITIQDGADGMDRGPLTQAKAGSQLELKVNLEYTDLNTGTVQYPCKDFSDTKNCPRFGKDLLPGTDQSGFPVKGDNTKGIANLLQFSGDSAVSLDLVSGGVLANRNYTWDSTYTGGPQVFTSPDFTQGTCGGEVLIFDDSGWKPGDQLSVQRFVLNSTNQPLNISYPHLHDYLNYRKTFGCGVDSTKTNFLDNYHHATSLPPFSIFGTPPDQPGGGGPGTGPTTGPTTGSGNTIEDTCAGASSSSLNWLVCPVVAGMGEAADVANNFVSGQLNIDIKDNFGNKAGPNSSIYTAWSVVKDLSSVILVIIMLVMVISQAAGGQMFDAYTVKKVLPKLVVAVIGMQLSWDIIIWIVGLFNDLGRGTMDLLAAPFGGGSALDLPALMHRLSGAWQALFSNPVEPLSISGLVLIIGAYLLWPTMLLGAFLAIMAVIAAMATLLVRNAILVLGLIVAPIALISWILPGTNRFWKYWYSNYSKALMLFPLAMAVIIGGRIFAWTAANLGAPGPLDAIMVFVGFLGPYIFLPKLFKYGGSILAQASTGINKARDQISKKPTEFFKNRQQGWSTELKRRSQERIGGKKEYGRVSKLWEKPIDKFASGKWDPTLSGRRKFEAMSGYAAAGRESAGKTFETAKNAAQQLFDTAADHDSVARQLLKGGSFKYIDKQGRVRTYTPPSGGKQYMRAAGAAGIAKYGTDAGYRTLMAELDRMRAKGGDDALLADEILDDNVDRLKPKMDSMYRGFNRTAYEEHLKKPGKEKDYQGAVRAGKRGAIASSADSLKTDWFNSMEGEEARSMLAGLSQGVAEGDPKSQQMMEKIWKDFMTASSNPNNNISPGVVKAFKAYAGGSAGNKLVAEMDKNRENEIHEVIKGDADNEGVIVRAGDAKADKIHRVDENTGEIKSVDIDTSTPEGLEKAEEAIRYTPRALSSGPHEIDHEVVLDHIKNDDGRNVDFITTSRAQKFMEQFDADGSKVVQRVQLPGGAPTGTGQMQQHEDFETGPSRPTAPTGVGQTQGASQGSPGQWQPGPDGGRVFVPRQAESEGGFGVGAPGEMTLNISHESIQKIGDAMYENTLRAHNAAGFHGGVHPAQAQQPGSNPLTGAAPQNPQVPGQLTIDDEQDQQGRPNA